MRDAPVEERSPVGVLESRRIGGLEELVHQSGEARRILEVREVRCTREGLEAAARDRTMGGAPVGERDRVVALTHDDEGGRAPSR